MSTPTDNDSQKFPDAPVVSADGAGSAKRELTFMEFISTEGGRKCPACGKYARTAELGFTGFSAPGIHVSSYGHLPGFGCNKPNTQPQPTPL